MIPFNQPHVSGKEEQYLKETFTSKKFAGDGKFTRLCHNYFAEKFGFNKCLLTTSCSSALDMSAILLDIDSGDEVIIPSYSFVTTANAFALRGANIVFADSKTSNPNIDETSIESLVTTKTKAIVLVHYAGIACDMDKIMQLRNDYNLYVVEDAAQAIDSYYKGQPLGSFGDLATFSFHETKNIQCGEGGLLVINNSNFYKRAEIIREKGTNRSQFFRGEIDKYGWVDVGSSFLPSEILAAFLYGQLEYLEEIQKMRIKIWNTYYDYFKKHLRDIKIPDPPDFATNNGHLFYLICSNEDERARLIEYLRENGIKAVFHYLSLHKSHFFQGKHDGRELYNSDFYSNCLLRLPLYYDLTENQVEFIGDCIKKFYNKN